MGERGGETVVSLENFDSRTHAQTVRRSGVEMSDLARSPLISGSNDPDSQGYKYKRRCCGLVTQVVAYFDETSCTEEKIFASFGYPDCPHRNHLSQHHLHFQLLR